MFTFVLATVLFGCNKDESIEFSLFNSTDDVLYIPVGVEDMLPAINQDLYSSTGAVPIGSISVDPGGGPIGTEHTLIVIVNDDFEHKVSRTTLELSSKEHGTESYTMNLDSADEGLYMLKLVSVGSEGETREDRLRVMLWKNEDEEGLFSGLNDDTGE